MSAPVLAQRHLHIVIEGFDAARLAELTHAGSSDDKMEIFRLTATNADQLLEKIFASDTVAVWSAL